MLDCMILGDSIAVGVGQARPDCVTTARTGITSGTYLQTLLPTGGRTASEVVISLGVNDDPSMDTLGNLRRLRARVRADRVTWLLPGLKETVRRHIRTVAAENQDRLVDTIRQVGPDRLHPTGAGYRVIAAWTMDGAAPLPQTRALAMGPMIVPMPASNTAFRNNGLPHVQTPSQSASLYTPWPPASAPFAAIPPRDYAFRAFAAAPTRTTVR